MTPSGPTPTDSSGIKSFSFKIGNGKIGKYSISFTFGTVFSRPVEFETVFPIE